MAAAKMTLGSLPICFAYVLRNFQSLHAFIAVAYSQLNNAKCALNLRFHSLYSDKSTSKRTKYSLTGDTHPFRSASCNDISSQIGAYF